MVYCSVLRIKSIFLTRQFLKEFSPVINPFFWIQWSSNTFPFINIHFCAMLSPAVSVTLFLTWFFLWDVSYEQHVLGCSYGKDAIFFLINLFYLFFFFWLRWVFAAVRGLSLVDASGVYSSLWCAGFSLRWLLLLWSTGSRGTGFSSCGTWA